MEDQEMVWREEMGFQEGGVNGLRIELPSTRKVNSEKAGKRRRRKKMMFSSKRMQIRRKTKRKYGGEGRRYSTILPFQS